MAIGEICKLFHQWFQIIAWFEFYVKKNGIRYVAKHINKLELEE